MQHGVMKSQGTEGMQLRGRRKEGMKEGETSQQKIENLGQKTRCKELCFEEWLRLEEHLLYSEHNFL